MKNSALLVALSGTLLLGFSAIASAYDDDPGYAERPYGASGSQRSLFGGRQQNYPGFGYGMGAESLGLAPSDAKPLYYKPTMRYYGNGYIVNYRYYPIYRADIYSSVLQGSATNFRTEPFTLSPEEVDRTGAGNARLTVKDNSSSGPRAAVTSIVRKKPPTRGATRGSKAAPDAVPAPSTDGPAPVQSAPGAATAPAAPEGNAPQAAPAPAHAPAPAPALR